MKKISASLFASMMTVAVSATGASAIAIDDFVESGGYKFTVTACANADGNIPCGTKENPNPVSGTLVAATDEIGFDVVFEPLIHKGVDGPAGHGGSELEVVDITIFFKVKSAGSALTDLTSDTLRLYGSVESSFDESGYDFAYINLTEQIVTVDASGQKQRQQFSVDMEAADMNGNSSIIVQNMQQFIVGDGVTLQLEKDLQLVGAFDGDRVTVEKYSQRFNEKVSAVPLPAPFLMLAAAISGLGFMGFRRRAA